MHVGDLMQHEVVTLEAEERLDLADNLMRLGRIRHLPIVSKGKLVGILSQRDLFRAAISSVLQLGYQAEKEWLGKIAVAAVMTPDPYTVGPQHTVRGAVALMLEHKVGCLPVVEDGKLVGLLSESDCLAHLAHVLDLLKQRQGLPEISQ